MNGNYIALINNFWDYATMNPLSTGQVSLYFALLHVCNSSHWTEWFQAPNQVLSVLTGMSRSGILKARNELKQRGLIDFRERSTKATIYMLIANSTQKSVQESKQNSVQISVQDSTQVGVQAFSNNNINNNINKQKQKQKEKTPASVYVEEFLSAYPKQGNRYLTEVNFVSCLMNENVTGNQLVVAARNYADRCRIEEIPQTFMKNPENFIKDMEYCQYLPGVYKPPKPVNRGYDANKGMMSTDYGDMSDLEKDLLAN